MDPQLQIACALLPLGEEGLGDTLVNQTEYVGKRLTTNTGVPGRLKKPQFADFYKDVLGADAETVVVVRKGYVIPFTSEPPPSSDTRNNASCVRQAEFAFAEILRLKALGCVREVEGPSRIELPLSVVFSNKMRLVADASRHLNCWAFPENQYGALIPTISTHNTNLI